MYLWRSGCVLGSFVASNNGKNTLSNNCWKLSKMLLDLNMSLKIKKNKTNNIKIKYNSQFYIFKINTLYQKMICTTFDFSCYLIVLHTYNNRGI